MRIIISPAKKMNTDTDCFSAESVPEFANDACRIVCALQALDRDALKKLWKCSDSLVELNAQRLQNMHPDMGRIPALFAYEGIQYQYMAPGVLDADSLDYLREHLRILSGLYGLLRPFDGVVPYRLEMQAKLSVDSRKDLYAFWGSRLADRLAGESDTILNLASKEYSKAVQPYLSGPVRFVTCSFAEMVDGKPAEKSTFCKIARGQMVRWLAEHKINSLEDVKNFDQMGYRFSPKISSACEFVFLKD